MANGDRYERMSCSNGKMLLPNDSEVDTVDKYSGRIITIDDADAKINYGDHFIHNTIDRDVDTDSPKEWVISSDNGKNFNSIFRFTSDDSGEIEIYEDATISDYGSRIYCVNSNRVIGEDPSDLRLHEDPTVSDDGDSIVIFLIGTGAHRNRGGGGSAASFTHLVLNTSEKDYLIRFTPDNDNTRVLLTDAFHEYKVTT